MRLAHAAYRTKRKYNVDDVRRDHFVLHEATRDRVDSIVGAARRVARCSPSTTARLRALPG